jgi:hypothetical protein
MHITQKPVKLCLAQLGFLVKHNHKFQHDDPRRPCPHDKGKETHRKALNRKVREGSAKIAKKRSWGQDFSFSSPEASSLPGTHAQNYMHG